MIKAVFTDVDDTLIDFYKSARVFAEDAFRECGLPYNEEIFCLYRDISESLWDKVNRRLMQKEALSDLRWELLFRVIGASCPYEEIDGRILVGLRSVTLCVDGAIELMEHLSPRYRIYAASNSGGDIQHDRLRVSGISPYLSGAFISSEVGYNKPDPRFFEHCLKEAGVTAEESVMIGDNVIADMSTPKAMGFTTILLDPGGTKDPTYADYVVQQLSDIKDII